MLETPGEVLKQMKAVATLYKQGQYDEAMRLAPEVVASARQFFGEKHSVHASSLYLLASLFQALGRDGAAEMVFCQVIDIQRDVVGEDHPDFAWSIHRLARLYHFKGNLIAAKPLYERATAVLAASNNDRDLRLASCLNNLSGVCHSLGQYANAEALLRRAVEIWRSSVGEEHPDFANSLMNLAGVCEASGNYTVAEPLYRRAVEILGQHPDSALYANALNLLAGLCETIGDYGEAERLYFQALEIYQRTLGHQHPRTAVVLNNLGYLGKSVGSHDIAEQFLKQAIKIFESQPDAESAEFADSLNNLAEVFSFRKKYDEAEHLFQRVMNIRRRLLGDGHPSLALCLNNLALLHEWKGETSSAEALFRQALTMLRSSFGESHSMVALPLNNLGLLCAVTGRQTEAMSLMQQAATINAQIIGQVFSIASEIQRLNYLATLEGNLHGFLSLVRQYLSGDSSAIESAFDLVLRRKAITTEVAAIQRDAMLSGMYPLLETKLQELNELRMQLARKTLAGPGLEGLSTHQQLLNEWGTQKERLESELARQIPEMNLEQKLQAADRQVIALKLPTGITLVEFIRFNVLDFATPADWDMSHWKPARYLAFVLPAGEPDNLQMIDLGEAEPIDRMIATFRAAITEEDESAGERGLGAWPGAQGGAASGGAGGGRGEREGQALRATLFDPLVKALGRRTRLLLAPDGDLTRLPFEVLPLAGGRRLIDEYQISYLGAGRDVLRWGAAVSGEASAPLVAADPDFDLSAAQDWDAAGGEQNAGRPVPGRRSRDLQRGLTTVERLEGTLAEGRRIAALLGVEPWLDKRALEARLKACRSPRILHLATHGFFLADQKRDLNESGRGLGALGAAGEWGRMAGPGMENPLLRSGLLLAGFNTWLAGDSLPAEAEDGILTAEDVSGLDLLATELVVLSACETGLGEIHVGEGVFGLRRAFMLAGAKTLVMSLWKVPDEQTRELMEDFYRRILRGEGRSEALRQAQLTMKQKYPDPYYWGAFICQGEQGPLALPAG